MGKSPDDIAGEIVDLRKESDVIVDELLRRATPSNVARGMTSTLTERASTVVSEASTRVTGAATTVSRVADQVADDIPEPIREHRMAVTYATVGVIAGLLGFVISWYSVMRTPTATDRAAKTLRRSRERTGQTAQTFWSRFQEGRHNIQNARSATARKEAPSMVKKLLWVGMASIMTTLGSILFKRMSASIWRTTMKENPPEK